MARRLVLTLGIVSLMLVASASHASRRTGKRSRPKTDAPARPDKAQPDGPAADGGALGQSRRGTPKQESSPTEKPRETFVVGAGLHATWARNSDGELPRLTIEPGGWRSFKDVARDVEQIRLNRLFGFNSANRESLARLPDLSDAELRDVPENSVGRAAPNTKRVAEMLATNRSLSTLASIPGVVTFLPRADGHHVVHLNGISTVIDRVYEASLARRNGERLVTAVIGNNDGARLLVRKVFAAAHDAAPGGPVEWFVGEASSDTADFVDRLRPKSAVVAASIPRVNRTRVTDISRRPDGRFVLTDSAGKQHEVDRVLIGAKMGAKLETQ
jgi:hypothetical protein